MSKKSSYTRGSRGGKTGTAMGSIIQTHEIEGVPKVKGVKRYGYNNRLRLLFEEAKELGLTAEVKEGSKRKYILVTPDSPLAGIECNNLDELDEEIENWRV